MNSRMENLCGANAARIVWPALAIVRPRRLSTGRRASGNRGIISNVWEFDDSDGWRRHLQGSRKSMDIREELDSISKEDLIELIIELSDNGYYPLELYLLRGSSILDGQKLENSWNNIYEDARRRNEINPDQAADILREGAELCLEKAKMFPNNEDVHVFCQMMIADLHNAAESDGIGMKSDSEGIYLEYAEFLKKY